MWEEAVTLLVLKDLENPEKKKFVKMLSIPTGLLPNTSQADKFLIQIVRLYFGIYL
jgi:hypothetical protein